MATTPTLLVRYSTDAPDDASPTWTTVTDDVRAFDTDRGRESELSDVDAGTATIVLDNRTGDWDTTTNALLQPMNRWNIRAVLPDTTTVDVFLGYAESYQMQWPGGGHDAITVVTLADEMKVLALDLMPATDPPRGTYQDLVMFDVPTGYWPMHVDNGQVAAVVGESLVPGGINIPNGFVGGAILGQADASYAGVTQHRWYQTGVLTYAMSGDAGGLAEFAIEGWFASSGTPGSTELLWSGPQGIPSHTFTWRLSLNTSNLLVLEVHNDSGTTHTCTSTTTAGSWMHVVGTIESGNLRLYINGVQEASTAWTGTIEGLDNGYTMIVGNGATGIGSNNRSWDEMAFYRTGLTAARVLAHYTAGTARGFALEGSGPRITAILDAAGSIAPRSIDSGGYQVTDLYMVGQDLLGEIRRAKEVEPANALFFVGKDGTITFRYWDYRSVAPYDTVQATFDDADPTMFFRDITIDYSDAFLVNEWNVTPDGGTTETASDATSIAAYRKRPLGVSISAPPSGGQAAPYAARMLSKFKDPLTRITSLSFITSTADLSNALLALELGDRIRVLVTQPNATRIDQTLFIQKVTVSGARNALWNVTLGVAL